jgi:glycine/serine hydroxymethyltransferase
VKQVVELISRLIDAPEDEAKVAKVKAEVHALAAAFPLYPGWA